MVVRIILTGKTGSGKSSVGAMLVQQNIFASSNKFEIGADLVGCTYKCKEETTDKFEVVDTVGLGEPIDGTVPDDEARKRLMEFVKKVKHPVNYIFFVISANHRYLEGDAAIFETVKLLFKGAEENIVLIITSANAAYMHTNRVLLEERYGKLQMINVEFPSVDDTDDEQERINIRKRKASYENLMVWLQSLNYAAKKPNFVDMTSAQIAEVVTNFVIYTLAAPFILTAAVVAIPVGLIAYPFAKAGEHLTNRKYSTEQRKLAKEQAAKIPEAVRKRIQNLFDT